VHKIVVNPVYDCVFVIDINEQEIWIFTYIYEIMFIKIKSFLIWHIG